MDTTHRRTRVVCGIDVGSTNLKVIALDRAGTVVARARRVPPRDPADLSVDAQELLGSVEEMILEVCGGDYTVAAVAAAGVGEDGVLVDDALRPVGRAMAWFDPRRNRMFQEIEQRLPEARGIGVATEPSRTLVGWLWAVRQAGAERASSWIPLTDYAASYWTKRPFISDTLAARTAAWNGQTRTWLIDRVNMTLGSADLLPEVIPTGGAVGLFFSPRLGDAGVLAPGAVVVAGGHDHPIGGWGVDQLHAGAILDSMGTAEVVVAQSPTPNLRRLVSVDVAPGIHGNGTTLLCVAELARNVDWACQDSDVAKALQEIILGTHAPNHYLHSSVFVPGAQGGGQPSFVKEAPADPLSRASAVVGALARVGSAAVEAVASHMAADAPVYAAGGWARSRGWMQIKENIAGTPRSHHPRTRSDRCWSRPPRCPRNRLERFYTQGSFRPQEHGLRGRRPGLLRAPVQDSRPTGVGSG